MFSHSLLAGGQLTPQRTMEIAVDNLQLSKDFRLTVLSDAIASLILPFKGGSTGKLFIYIAYRRHALDIMVSVPSCRAQGHTPSWCLAIFCPQSHKDSL